MSKQSKCDYTKGIIYKIKCRDRSIKDIYIGSTTNFVSRKANHKSNCNNTNSKDYMCTVYQFIRSHGGWDNWEMIPIKTYSCNSHMELVIEEQSMIEQLEEYTTLNRHRAFTDDEKTKEKAQEYRGKNKELIAKKSKDFYNKNRDKIKEYRGKNKELIAKKSKEFYNKNREKILKQKKEYSVKNKEVLKERHRVWRTTNKEKIVEKRKEKVICECGSKVCKNNISSHRKTLKHQTWEQQPEPNLIFVD